MSDFDSLLMGAVLVLNVVQSFQLKGMRRAARQVVNECRASSGQPPMADSGPLVIPGVTPVRRAP